jgi:hypothetical protein
MLVFDRRSFLKSATVGAVATACGSAGDVTAASPDVPVEAPGFYRFHLGEFHIAPLCDGGVFSAHGQHCN